MEYFLEIAFSGFWNFIGSLILLNTFLYFVVNGIVRTVLAIASIFNKNIKFKD